MRGFVLLLAAAASAQDNRGFVNERLLTNGFVKNSLNLKAPAAAPKETPTLPAPKGPLALVTPKGPLKLGTAKPPLCASPLVQVKPAEEIDPSMTIRPPKDSGDEGMILKTIPVCPAK